MSLFPFNKSILPMGGTITILGSTGSIGVNTLSVYDDLKEDSREFHIKTLTAGTNYKLLARQALRYRPEIIAIADKTLYPFLKEILSDFEGEILAGEEGVIAAASQRADYVMSAIVGTAGLRPTLAAAHKNTVIALANKECTVTAGAFFTSYIESKGAFLFPIDSEHNALYHLLAGMDIQKGIKCYLTASGGPFRNMDIADFKYITPKDAIKNPNWTMGAKISVDSATMMNKGLELIEACVLFDLPFESYDAVIHPQSFAHAMITSPHGDMRIYASQPDMCVPIKTSFCYGHKVIGTQYAHDVSYNAFNPLKSFEMNFYPIDEIRYPCFKIAKEVLKQGQAMPTILNAANEVAVDGFLKEMICFDEIACVIRQVIDNMSGNDISESYHSTTIEAILHLDKMARDMSRSVVLDYAKEKK